MPELVHVRRRRRNGMFRLLARQSIEKSSVFELHLCRLFGAPPQMLDDFKPNRVKIQTGYVPLRKQSFEHFLFLRWLRYVWISFKVSHSIVTGLREM